MMNPKLEAILRSCGKLAIAFSGGTDSTLLAEAARRVLGAENVLLLHAESVLLPAFDREFTADWIARGEMRVIAVPCDPLADPRIRANDPQRCYHCKKAIFGKLLETARAHGFATLADGANLDDLGDYRPGMLAAAEMGVTHPLLEAGMTKAAIRELAREFKLENADRPASACLASRIPTGTPLDETALGRIDRAEYALHQLGFRQLRVRALGELAKLEFPPQEFPAVLAKREAVVAALSEAGFSEITLDLRGYRMGAMNAATSE